MIASPSRGEPRPTWRDWLQATRPATLAASAAPVLVGAALAASHGVLSPALATAALVTALALQVGANLVNDAGDFARGADRPDRLGPPRLAQTGKAPSRALYRAAGLAFAVAVAAGLPLALRGGWPLVLAGLAALVAAVTYTVGPRPLAYVGLGDAAVLLFFGPVAVAGTYYAQALDAPAPVLLLSLAPGLLATNILVVNNLRDRAGDAAAGKRTLVVRWGARAGRRQYAASALGAFLLPAALVLTGRLPAPALLCLAAAPRAVREVRAIARTEGAALNPHLGAAARLEALFCACLAAGLVWGHAP